jgi:NitT/TauT family transport system substrate-binding protein
LGLQEVQEGKIRIVGRGSEVPSLRDQTIRVLIVNANSLKERKDAILRFMKAYRESVDWMYSNPQAITMYAAKIKRPESLIKTAVDQFQPRPTMQTERMADLDGSVKGAVQLKFLDKPLTKDELAELIQIPAPGS